MNNSFLADQPHHRFNTLNGDWVLVSPHRSKRPWQGKVEKVEEDNRPAYDPTCYLCPGNARVGGEENPAYKGTFVFNNDFGALQENVEEQDINIGGLLKAGSERGICRVICFSPRHDLTLPEMTVPDIRKIVDLWVSEFQTLGEKAYINYVQIFENKGAMMGCSNPHPHGQIWAQQHVPLEPAKEEVQQKKYYQENNKSLLLAYLELELGQQERIVAENQSFVALVPFWAVWPYEVMIISRRHIQHIGMMTEQEKDDYADMLRQVTIMYDNVFEISFPYSAGIHQSPTDGEPHPEWHLHMHFYPPLLRSATVKKFMVGYEMLGNPQRDITPESSAEKLRGLSKVHYKKTSGGK